VEEIGVVPAKAVDIPGIKEILEANNLPTAGVDEVELAESVRSQKRGFQKIERDEVHPQLLVSREFQDACPSSAVCMRMVMLS
jgi:hypothetical protein